MGAASRRIRAACQPGAPCSEDWAELRHPGNVTVHKLHREAARTEFAGDDGVRAELKAFAEAVAGTRPYPVTLDQAVHGTDTMEAVIASVSTGAPVSVERISPWPCRTGDQEWRI